MNGIIYLAVNRVNQKAYVGQTTHDLGYRLSGHLYRSRSSIASYFQRAINKYGVLNFDFSILQRCETKDELNDAERKWIAEIGSISPVGYNIAAGGEGSLCGRKSQAWRESVTSDSVREKHSIRCKLWRASMTPDQKAEHQAKINASKKGLVMPHLVGDRNPAKLPEVRKRITEGQRRAWSDPVAKARRIALSKATREAKK